MATDSHGESPSGSQDQLSYEALTPEDKEEIYRHARRRARMKLAFWVHATVYVMVMLLLAVINLLASPGTWWVIWPLFGWGLGLLLHWIFGVRFVGMYRSLEEREIAREMEDLAR